MTEGIKKSFTGASQNPADLAVGFYKGLERTFRQNTAGGWDSAERKAEALEAINDYIDENGASCFLSEQRRDALKASIATLADQENERVRLDDGSIAYRTKAPERVFTEVDITDAFIEMTEGLGQERLLARSVSEAIEVMNRDKSFSSDLVLPMARLTDHITEAQHSRGIEYEPPKKGIIGPIDHTLPEEFEM